MRFWCCLELLYSQSWWLSSLKCLKQWKLLVKTLKKEINWQSFLGYYKHLTETLLLISKWKERLRSFSIINGYMKRIITWWTKSIRTLLNNYLMKWLMISSASSYICHSWDNTPVYLNSKRMRTDIVDMCGKINLIVVLCLQSSRILNLGEKRLKQYWLRSLMNLTSWYFSWRANMWLDIQLTTNKIFCLKYTKEMKLAHMVSPLTKEHFSFIKLLLNAQVFSLGKRIG